MKYLRQPSPPATSPGELQVRLPCRGRRAEDVLVDLVLGLAEAKDKKLDPLIVLENLGELQGSIMTLIKGISRCVVNYPRPISFWENSGFTEAFLSVMDPEDRP